MIYAHLNVRLLVLLLTLHPHDYMLHLACLLVNQLPHRHYEYLLITVVLFLIEHLPFHVDARLLLDEFY